MKAICYVLLLCLAGATRPAVAGLPGEIGVGGTLGEATLRGLSGPPAQLSAFRGKPLIINVWASWCGPCRDEMASLERLARRFGVGRFNVIGISTDDYPEAAAAALKQGRTSFPNFIDNNLALENMLGANRIPLTVLVDANGRVLRKVFGSRVWDSEESLNLIGRTFRIKL